MIYLESTSNSPYFNLALEQYVFDNLSKSQDCFMLWQNANAIIIGKHQNAIEEINTDFVQEHDIKVVRRLSGGGAVYHDLGNLNYTFITNDDRNENLDFAFFSQPLIHTLNKLGICSKISGRNDVTIDGCKISGTAQYKKNNRILHHGTILFNSDISILNQALKAKSKAPVKAFQSIYSRVTNIHQHLTAEISLHDFKSLFLEYVFSKNTMFKHTLTKFDVESIEEISKEIYSTHQWNFKEFPAYSIKKSRRIEHVGTLNLTMDINDNVITRCSVSGDYFGEGDSSNITRLLVGNILNRNELLNLLSGLEIDYYFHNLSKETFIDIILN